MTEEEKQEIIKDFQKKFDIIKLSSEIQSRLTTPASSNQSYEAKCRKVEQFKTKLGKIFVKIEMMTEKREVLEMVTQDLTCSTARLAQVGKWYRVVYTGDEFKEITILEEVRK